MLYSLSTYWIVIEQFSRNITKNELDSNRLKRSAIVSSQKLIYPESEDSLINALENKKILSKTMAEKIMDLKGFRNILIHKYGELDDHRAYKFLTEELGNFKLFEKDIKKYLKMLKE